MGQDNPTAGQTPWYESNLLWGPLGIVLTVVSAAKHDLRWLLLFPWICFVIAAWLRARRFRGARWITAAAALVVGCGLLGMSRWLRPPSAEVAGAQPAGRQDTVGVGDKSSAKVVNPSIKAEVKRAEKSATQATSQAGALHTIKVTDENDNPLKGAEILFVRPNGTHLSRIVSNNVGVAEIQMSLDEVVSVFCALDGFSSYYQTGYNLTKPLTIRLKKNLNGGSVIFADGTGYVAGLSGRLNPILDTQGRTYLYAGNIAIDGGRRQPVTFILNRPLILEDSDGHKVEIEITAILGSSSLIEYRSIK